MTKLLRFTYIGNPILREKARELTAQEVLSSETQQLIEDMRYTIEKEKAGVGLAAPQVDVGVALSLIAIKPTPNRPDRERFESVIINPTYEGLGRRTGMWEGCVSCGRGMLFGKALRYKKVSASWYDSDGQKHESILDGFIAHVFQHETDHLNGTLFVDRVRDTKTYMMETEYRKRIVKGKG